MLFVPCEGTLVGVPKVKSDIIHWERGLDLENIHTLIPADGVVHLPNLQSTALMASNILNEVRDMDWRSSLWRSRSCSLWAVILQA